MSTKGNFKLFPISILNGCKLFENLDFIDNSIKNLILKEDTDLTNPGVVGVVTPLICTKVQIFVGPHILSNSSDVPPLLEVNKYVYDH